MSLTPRGLCVQFALSQALRPRLSFFGASGLRHHCARRRVTLEHKVPPLRFAAVGMTGQEACGGFLSEVQFGANGFVLGVSREVET